MTVHDVTTMKDGAAVHAFFRFPEGDTLHVSVQRMSDVSTNGNIGPGDVLMHGSGVIAIALDTGDGRRVIIPWEDITGITVMDRREQAPLPVPEK